MSLSHFSFSSWHYYHSLGPPSKVYILKWVWKKSFSIEYIYFQIKSTPWLMKCGKWFCTPTPRKSLVCPPPLSSLSTCLRLWGCICDNSHPELSASLPRVVSTKLDPYMSLYLLLFPSWPWLLPHFKPKLPSHEGSLEVAPIWAAFCNKAVADMFADEHVCWGWCWEQYKEGTLEFPIGSEVVVVVLVVNSWLLLLLEILVPNT